MCPDGPPPSIVAAMAFEDLGRRDHIPQATNPRKDRQIWMRIARVTTWEGASLRNSRSLYIYIVQSMLLYGTEMWTAMEKVLEVLEWMHWGLVWKISKRRASFDRAMGSWSHFPAVEPLEVADLLPLGE